MTVVVPGMDLDGERVECQPMNGKLGHFLATYLNTNYL